MAPILIKDVRKMDELQNGVRQFYKLPMKSERDERKFNEWTDEAFRVFGFSTKEVKHGKSNWSNGRERER